VLAQANTAGLVVNTMGWVDGLGYELLLHSIQALQASNMASLARRKPCVARTNVTQITPQTGQAV